ncbi:MAG: hypothetical protein IJ343_13925 [Clostridia bacterium]|nr:hypothetical protein [Clostridia bacterium]
MDNQYNQSGGGYPPQYPAGQQPAGNPPVYGTGINPQPGYTAGQQPYVNPADPYGTGQQPYVNPADPYGTGQQPYVNPTDPYGTGQQPYVNPADSFGTGQQPYVNPADPYGTGQQASYTAGQFGAAPYSPVQQPYADPGAYQQPYSTDGYQHLFDQGQQEQEQPPAGFPPQERRPQKRRMTAADIALVVVALLAVVGFAGWYLYATYAPEAAKTGFIATGNLSAVHSGECLIVRNERSEYADSVNSIVYEASEGSRIAHSTRICRIYTTYYSASAVKQLQEYRDEIRDYQESLMESSTVYDGKLERHNGDIMTLAKEIRSLIHGAQGSLTNIEASLTQAVQLRQDYLDVKYADNQRYSNMKDNERSQKQRINSWTKVFTSTTDAIVSFYSDGFEHAINGSNYGAFEPQQVRAMINGKKPELAAALKGKTPVYRMVKDNEWYVLFLSDDIEWNPVNGETYELQLERFGDTPVTATVVSFTKSGGELLVRLRVNGPVEQVMYLRSCEAVLGESMSTLMANERAIHEQDGMTGVVLIEGSTQSFIPVNVLLYQDGYVYFQTVQQGMLYEDDEILLF